MREEAFRQIAETIPEVFWVTDAGKQETLYVSPAYEKIWGRPVEALYAAPRSFLDAIHPDDRARVEAALPQQALGTYHEEYRIVRPDGSERWIRDRAFPLRDAQGAVARIVGLATDITERNATVGRERLRSQELDERLRRLIETANDAVLTIDERSIILDWNATAERMFGWTRAEAVGQRLTDLIVPGQHRQSHHAGLAKYLSTGEHGILNRRVETTALARDGREFAVELSVWPVKTGAGHTFSSFIRDISERKEAEAALKRSEERYRAVVENANEGIIVTQDGRIKFANDKAFRLSDRSADEVYSTPFIEMVHPEDRARVYGNYLRRMRGEAVESHYNFRVVTPANEVRWLQIAAVAIEWEGRPATLNFLSDVTQQVALEESLRLALARERELSDLKGRFVALASHEFRTPLSAILSSVELIEDFGASMPEAERSEVIRLIKGSVRRMTDMLEQILLVGRAEGRGLEFRPAPLDIAALCRRVLDETASAARRKVDLELEAPDAGPRLADERLLRHALANLVSNAIKYSRDGGRVRVALEPRPDGLLFRVSDEGIGIPAEDQPRLFERFHRGGNVGGIEGTGLGLTIVRECVELHGGSVRFESRLGTGSTFVVEVPAPRA